MENRSILITGANGFIGSSLVHRFLGQGFQVHAILRETSDISSIDLSNSSLHIWKHDGSTSGLIEIVKNSNPRIVFHLASLFLSEHTSSDVERLVESNVLFSTQLAEAMAINGIKLLINTGTSWQHFDNREYDPVCLYAAFKEAYQCILKYYVECQGLKVITLKLFDTYGPHDKRSKLINLLRQKSLSGETLSMSPGQQLIDLVYIDDVIDAFEMAFELIDQTAGSTMQEYAVSSGLPLQLREIASIYEEASKRPLNIIWGGRNYRAREVMKPWTNFRLLPNWQPKIDLITGIRLTLQ